MCAQFIEASPYGPRDGDLAISAVVVGGAGACGLGVVRSLSRANVPVILIDTDAYAPAMFSRFARKVTVSGLRGRPLVDALLALRASITGSAVLFLTDDEAVLTVSQHRAELASGYRFRLPTHECLTALMYKSSFQQLAEAHGFLVPRSLTIDRSSDLLELATLKFPCVVKPKFKGVAYVQRRFERAYKVGSHAHAQAVCRRILPFSSGLIVQEWIDGADSDLYFCLQYRGRDGKTLCSFTGRKLSIWPPDVGVTASCTAAVDAHPTLQSLTERFFDCASFVGMGSIEFKKEAASGQFFMIEPTVGRVDWQEEVATLHGANIPLAAYRHEIGLDVTAMEESARPVVWRDGWAHHRALRTQHTQRDVARGTKVYDAYWRVYDPMPALVRAMIGSKRAAQRAVRRARMGKHSSVRDPIQD